MDSRTDSIPAELIAISLLTLVPGQLGGSETYARELLRGLARVGELDYRVLLPPAAPAAAEGLPAEPVPEYRRAETMAERLAAMTLAAAHPGPLRAHLGAARVVHYPFTLRIPSSSVPSVVTLHDVQHLDLPAMFGRGERAFRAVAWRRSVRGADRVVVPSGFVRDRAIARLGLPGAAIRVVPSAVDRSRFNPGPVEREPFLFYPARAWPHKNHERLFEAFAIARRSRPELRLVLTGGGSFPPLPDGAETLGFVGADELVSLYRRAALLVFPSLYEGFGQPPLEAMACGCPVVCSDVAALPEVVGDAARLFDPHDPESIAVAVLDVLEDPGPWSERGLRRAAEFSWDTSARGHEAVYRELL